MYIDTEATQCRLYCFILISKQGSLKTRSLFVTLPAAENASLIACRVFCKQS